MSSIQVFENMNYDMKKAVPMRLHRCWRRNVLVITHPLSFYISVGHQHSKKCHQHRMKVQSPFKFIILIGDSL